MAREQFNKQNREDLNERFLRAVKNGELEKVKRHLEAGANINTKDSEDDTALLWAIKNNQTGTALLLIEKKASLEAQDAEGSTALLHAVKAAIETKDYLIVRRLIEESADINAENRFGESPFRLALSSREKGLVEIFETPMKAILNKIPLGDQPATDIRSLGNNMLSNAFARIVLPPDADIAATALNTGTPTPALTTRR